MSPGIRKLAIAFGVVLVVVVTWSYLRMPSPSVAGLDRPKLTLMDAGNADGSSSAVRPGQRPAGERKKVNKRRSNKRRRPSRVNRRSNDDSDSARNTRLGTTKFNREEWRKKRVKAMKKRAAGNLEPVEDLVDEEIGGDELEELPPDLEQQLLEEEALEAEGLGEEPVEGEPLDEIM